MVPYRRGGFRGLGLDPSSINPTTIWTPSTGYLAETGTLSAGYQYQPQVFSAYDVPGLLLPAPDCTQASGGAFVSSECVDKALAIQQQNFQRTADYNANYLTAVRNAPTGPPPVPVASVTMSEPLPVVAPASGPSSPAAPGTAERVAATAKNYVTAAEGFLTETVPVAGFDIPGWGLALAGVAALFMFGGRR